MAGAAHDPHLRLDATLPDLGPASQNTQGDARHSLLRAAGTATWSPHPRSPPPSTAPAKTRGTPVVRSDAMAFWFPLGPFASRPETLWAQRVLFDLSALHDAGAFHEVYLRRAWLTIMLVQLGDEPLPDEPALRTDLVRWMVQRAGLGEHAHEVPTVDEVFGVVERGGAGVDGSPVKATEEEPDVIHLLPGFSIAGRRWEFHLTDKDSNRPAPHGHDIEDHSVVLDPYTGAVFDKNGKALKSAKPKELRELMRYRRCPCSDNQRRSSVTPLSGGLVALVLPLAGHEP